METIILSINNSNINLVTHHNQPSHHHQPQHPQYHQSQSQSQTTHQQPQTPSSQYQHRTKPPKHHNPHQPLQHSQTTSSQHQVSSTHHNQHQVSAPPGHHNNNLQSPHNQNHQVSSGSSSGSSSSSSSVGPVGPPALHQHMNNNYNDYVSYYDPELPAMTRTLSNTEQDILDIINMAYTKRPQKMDTFEPTFYVPISTYPTPRFFPKERPKLFDDPDVFSLMELDTLFFAFYFQTQSYQQFMAAKELKTRGWSFIKNIGPGFNDIIPKVIFQNLKKKDNEGDVKENGDGDGMDDNDEEHTISLRGKGQHVIIDKKYEKGTYIFFDQIQSWQMRMREISNLSINI